MNSGSYLKSLTTTLKQSLGFPFPSKSPMYNLGARNGFVLKGQVALVGVVTCPDDGGVKRPGEPSVLNCIECSRFRFPDLSTAARVKAFERAFENEGIELNADATKALPVLTASVISARGEAFTKVARKLRHEGQQTKTRENLIQALSILKEASGKYQIVVAPSEDVEGDDLFASVGGNIEAKLALEDALAVDPVKRNILKRFGMAPPTGVLLYGPPGTGKTLLAKAVAKLLKANTSNRDSPFGGAFFSLQASEIVRSEVGNSEKLIVQAFGTARSNAPAVIFIDEFQALFTERGGGGSQLASTLLQCMDDITKWGTSHQKTSSDDDDGKTVDSAINDRRIVVLGATNTPWMVDAAFIRPGRFDRVVHVGLPTEIERLSILRVHLRRMELRSEDDMESICKKLSFMTDGFSGADLAALCRAGAVRCLSMGDDQVKLEHFCDALKDDIHASSNERLVQRLLDWKP